jgi:hypothetical protein
MDQGSLLDSARHKILLAGYHAKALTHVLALSPTEDADDPRRIEMEAHLEGLAYTGTAAAEKTLRTLDPAGMPNQIPVEGMIRHLRQGAASESVTSFVGRFERWWFDSGRGLAPTARDLRNDSAHRVYAKSPDGPGWRMEITGRHEPILLSDFASDYLNDLQDGPNGVRG